MNYKTFATQLARESGAIMRSHFGFDTEREWKGDGTPVTVADKKINDLVVKRIQSTFPDHGIIAEEGSPPLAGQEYVWVCDPIDGTIPFAHGIPFSTFALALVQDGTPILGVAYDPILDRLFVAEQNKGTTMNGKRVHVNHAQDSFEKNIICSMLWTNTGAVGDMLATFLSKGAVVMTPLSCVYSAALVAAGACSALVFSGPMPWDAAASVILVEEAGGRVTDLFGESQRYDRITRGFIASNGTRIHDDLLAIIKKNFKPEDFLPYATRH